MDGLEQLTHNGQRGTREDSSKESTNKDGLEILRNRDGDLEDGKDEHAHEHGFFPAMQLGQRAEYYRTERKAQDKKADGEDHNFR